MCLGIVDERRKQLQQKKATATASKTATASPSRRSLRLGKVSIVFSAFND